MTEVSEIQIHIEQMIDLLNKVKKTDDAQKEKIKEQQEEIESLEKSIQNLSVDYADAISNDGYTHVKISGMGSIEYRIEGSQDVVIAFENFIKNQIEKYTGNRPESL